MKKMLKLLGIMAAMAMVLGFGLTACSSGDDDDDGFPSKTLEKTFAELEIPADVIPLLKPDTVRVKDASIATLEIKADKFVLKSLKEGETAIQVKMEGDEDWHDSYKVIVGKDGSIKLEEITNSGDEGNGGGVPVNASWSWDTEAAVLAACPGLTSSAAEISGDIVIVANEGADAKGAKLTLLGISSKTADSEHKAKVQSKSTKAGGTTDIYCIQASKSTGSTKADYLKNSLATFELVLDGDCKVTAKFYGTSSTASDDQWVVITNEDGSEVIWDSVVIAKDAAPVKEFDAPAGTYKIWMSAARLVSLSCKNDVTGNGGGESPAVTGNITSDSEATFKAALEKITADGWYKGDAEAVDSISVASGSDKVGYVWTNAYDSNSKTLKFSIKLNITAAANKWLLLALADDKGKELKLVRTDDSNNIYLDADTNKKAAYTMGADTAIDVYVNIANKKAYVELDGAKIGDYVIAEEKFNIEKIQSFRVVGKDSCAMTAKDFSVTELDEVPAELAATVFTPDTKPVTNDSDTLGLVATDYAVDPEGFVTVAIADGNISITSIEGKIGSATVKAKAGENEATIEIKVSPDGTVGIERIKQYSTNPASYNGGTVKIANFMATKNSSNAETVDGLKTLTGVTWLKAVTGTIKANDKGYTSFYTANGDSQPAASLTITTSAANAKLSVVYQSTTGKRYFIVTDSSNNVVGNGSVSSGNTSLFTDVTGAYECTATTTNIQLGTAGDYTITFYSKESTATNKEHKISFIALDEGETTVAAKVISNLIILPKTGAKAKSGIKCEDLVTYVLLELDMGSGAKAYTLLTADDYTVAKKTETDDLSKTGSYVLVVTYTDTAGSIISDEVTVTLGSS